MDLKKEREAFERLPLAELAIESEYVYYNEETNSYWPKEDFCPSDAPETMSFAWQAWQAAKAHEAEKLKGKVVVPFEPTDLMINAYRDNSVAPVSTLSVSGYKAMLEAARGGNE